MAISKKVPSADNQQGRTRSTVEDAIKKIIDDTERELNELNTEMFTRAADIENDCELDVEQKRVYIDNLFKMYQKRKDHSRLSAYYKIRPFFCKYDLW